MKLELEPAGQSLQIGSPQTKFCPQTCFFFFLLAENSWPGWRF